MAISSLGVGSGIDIQGLLEQLVAAERAPTEGRLNKKELTLQSQLSAIGTIKGALGEFQSALSSLKSLSGFQSRSVSSSDSASVSATASGSAAAGEYGIVVSQLAKAHSLASTAFTATTDIVGTGTLTFRFGTTVYDKDTDTYTSFTQNADVATKAITIDSNNNTLTGIRDAVNDANFGVRASIVNDGTGYRLLFTAKNSGAANSLEVSADDGDGNDIDASGLSQLVFNASATNLEQTQGAQDAAFTVDGLAITSAKNTGITGVIDGLTLNLSAADATKTINLSVSQNTAAVKESISSFVSAYNSLVDVITTHTRYDAETGKAGVLIADAGVRNIGAQLRSIFGSTAVGSNDIRSLADLGIRTESTGKLTLDDAKLTNALNDHFDEIGYLFTAAGRASDGLISYAGATASTQVGRYAVNVSQLANQGSYTGAAASSFVVGADNDTFALRVDGTVSGTITLTQKTYASGSELAAELQSRINGDATLSAAGIKVGVSYVGNQFVITSDRYGASSEVVITTADTTSAATLGIGTAVGTSSAGVDVAGSIGGVAASGSGRTLTAAGNAQGLAIDIIGGSLGDRGTISFNRGVADRLDTLIASYLDTDGLFEARGDGLNDRITDINDQRAALEKRLVALERRYRARFTALDALVSQLQSTGQYLQQQLANLPGTSRSDK